MTTNGSCGFATDRWVVLDDLAKAGPMPTVRINRAMVEWFVREKVTVPVMLPSPWPLDHGRHIEHQRITAVGRSILGEQP